MAARYRYIFTGVGQAFIQRFVPGGVTVTNVSEGAQAFCDVTLSGAISDRSDLDEIMSQLGWSFYSQPADIQPLVASRFQTALFIDFSSLPNQALGADGTYTIGGVANVKKENSTIDWTPMAIVNGQGLTIQPNGGNYFGSSRTQPLLWFPFGNFYPDLDWGQEVRVTVELLSDSGGSGNYCILTLDNDSMSWAYAALRGNVGNMIADATVSTSTAQGGRTIQLGSSVGQSGVFGLQTPGCLVGASGGMVTQAFAAAPPMPAVDKYGSMTPVCQATQSVFTDLGKIVPSSGGAGSNLGVSIGASGTSGYKVVVKSLRVDVG